MLGQVVWGIWKEMKIYFKDPAAIALVFLMPLMLIVIMSLALADLYRLGRDRPIPILVLNQDRGPHGEAVLDVLKECRALCVETQWRGNPLNVETVESLVREGERRMGIVFPEDFSRSLDHPSGFEGQEPAKVLIFLDPTTTIQRVEPVFGTVRGIIQRVTIRARIPRAIEVVVQKIAPDIPENLREAYVREAGKAVFEALGEGDHSAISLEATGMNGIGNRDFPDSYQQNIPAFTVFGIFWIVMVLAESVLRERREGTLLRLAATPVTPAAFLLGKLVPYFLISLLQIVVMFGAGRLLFGLELGGSMAGMALVSLAVSASATSLGVLVAAVARTEAQAGGLTALLLVTLSALGGCFVPRFAMPEWLRSTGLLTPHAWALEGYQDLLVRELGLRQVLPEVGVLLAFSLLFLLVGLWGFPFRDAR